MSSRSILVRIAVKIFIFCAIILGAVSFHRSGLLQSMIPWIEGLGPAWPVVFLLIFAAAAVSHSKKVVDELIKNRLEKTGSLTKKDHSRRYSV